MLGTIQVLISSYLYKLGTNEKLDELIYNHLVKSNLYNGLPN